MSFTVMRWYSVCGKYHRCQDEKMLRFQIGIKRSLNFGLTCVGKSKSRT